MTATGERTAIGERAAHGDSGASRDRAACGERAAVLRGEDLRVSYGGRNVLDVPEIELHEGELLALLGPNGAGKSTLFRVLAMLERPAGGRVSYRGREGREAERALRAASAAVFQRPHLWRGNVLDNVALGLRLRGLGRREREARALDACELVGIGHLARRDVATLSGGEVQRVALARALVLEPDVLFLDEPTASLDAPGQAELREDLERIARRGAGSVLLVTHDRHEAFFLADRIAVLVEGRIVQAGAPVELYKRPADPYIARVTGAELALQGTVRAVEPGLVVVDVEGVLLRAVGTAGPGTPVKVAYRPEDLVLGPRAAGEPASPLSTRNRFPATVDEVRDVGAFLRVRLAGPPDTIAVVTREAAEELGLRPGTEVDVRTKATALHAFPV